jgi:endonuclease/exonuclease/phosphatase family metal-dependent hydrolase
VPARAGLRVLSANLANGAADPAAFARLVADVRADVVALQELGPVQADAIREVLPHGCVEGRRDYHGMGIATREPARVERVELPYRGAVAVHLEGDEWRARLGGRARLEIVNVHIAAPHLQPVPRGLWIRRQQVAALARHLRERSVAARVLVGDLNATPLWPAYQRLLRAAELSDAALEVAQRRGRRRVERTWSRWPGGPRLLRIDHGFVRGVRVDEFQVIPIVQSDHAAILMDLRVEEAARPDR